MTEDLTNTQMVVSIIIFLVIFLLIITLPLYESIEINPDFSKIFKCRRNKMEQKNTLEQIGKTLIDLRETVGSLSNKLEKVSKVVQKISQTYTSEEKEPKFERLPVGEKFWIVDYCHNKGFYTLMNEEFDYNDISSERYFANNNYFHSEARAKEVADKVKFMMYLERLHDIYCPDYIPDWMSDDVKYCVWWNNNSGEWCYTCNVSCEHLCQVYFPTRNIAKKICDILNQNVKPLSYAEKR